MAAFNKLGSLLRHNALMARSTAALSPGVFNAARLMSTKLFGERVAADKESGRSRGFCFASNFNSEEAKKAMLGMEGQEINEQVCSGKALSSNSLDILSYMGDGEQKELIKKLVNFRMKDGKKTRVRAIVYKTFHRLARSERDVINLMGEAVDNVKPICEVVKVGVAGTVYDVPGIVPKDRQQALAIRWIFGGALKRRMSYRISLEKCLFDEILDAYRKRGNARKRRENLHGLASANRSFAHFRWW